MRVRNFFLLLWIAPLTSLTAQSENALQPGSMAPNFFLKYLDQSEFYSKDYYGEPRSLPKAKKERNTVILSFFASWCGPCRKEIPELEKLQSKYADVRIFLINVAETQDKVLSFLAENPVTLPVLMDIYGKTAEKFDVKDKGLSMAVLPTLVMIRKDGTVHFYKKGYTAGDEIKIEEQILTLLAQP